MRHGYKKGREKVNIFLVVAHLCCTEQKANKRVVIAPNIKVQRHLKTCHNIS